LSYEDLEWGWNFSSEQCEEGMVGIHSNYLRSVTRVLFTRPRSHPPCT